MHGSLGDGGAMASWYVADDGEEKTQVPETTRAGSDTRLFASRFWYCDGLLIYSPGGPGREGRIVTQAEKDEAVTSYMKLIEARSAARIMAFSLVILVLYLMIVLMPGRHLLHAVTAFIIAITAWSILARLAGPWRYRRRIWRGWMNRPGMEALPIEVQVERGFRLRPWQNVALNLAIWGLLAPAGIITHAHGPIVRDMFGVRGVALQEAIFSGLLIFSGVAVVAAAVGVAVLFLRGDLPPRS
jgi:hypothetical protein